MNFFSLYRHGFARIAACPVGPVIADPPANLQAMLTRLAECDRRGVALAVFPELCLTGYAIDDLLLQDPLLDAATDAIGALTAASRALLPVIVAGAPLRHGNRLYNCAVVIHRGRLLGVVPKSHLPNYREFYEKRHFASGVGVDGDIRVGALTAPFGTDLIFAADDLPDFKLAVEICEDLWVPVPPSSLAALGGATVLANLSASPATVGRARSRTLLCQAQSLRCLAAYVYTAAGDGESTTDLAWDGQACVCENGTMLRDGARFETGGAIVVADLDLDLLRQERQRTGSFDDNARTMASPFRTIGFRLDPPDGDLGLERDLERFPFVPADPARLAEDCAEAFHIQVAGLATRLRAIGQPKPVIGVSGGLDSTHALLVCARAMDRLGRPRADILAYTMPGFATGADSRQSAHDLMRALGVTAHELDITPAARQMLHDLGHPAAAGTAAYDITFENIQAGLRTDYLFRLANQQGGLVIGTGDLSELALGWCTFGVGDQMAHYGVNGGVPKTLIQHLIRHVIATEEFDPSTRAILAAVVEREISPELVPAGDGVAQGTEAVIGPYALQDFTLFHTLRHGFRPSRIAFLAHHAWRDADAGTWPVGYPAARRRAYTLADIRRWLGVFVTRFFGQMQYKRSTLPNGPKVVAGGSLSPRGDWRAPADGNARIWLADLDKIPIE